jgi:hypothetical protein
LIVFHIYRYYVIKYLTFKPFNEVKAGKPFIEGITIQGWKCWETGDRLRATGGGFLILRIRLNRFDKEKLKYHIYTAHNLVHTN